MVDTLSSQPAPPPVRGLAARVIGVLTSPRATYADVAAHPRWFGVLIVVLATTITSSSLLLSTEVGQRAVIDQQLQGADASFSQVFAVVVCSVGVTGVRALFATPLNYARESLSSPTTLTAIVPFFEDNTFPGRLLGSIDLFLIWWIV